MRNGRLALAALGLAAAAAAGPAAAQDRSFYLGGSIGHGEYNDTCDDVALIPGCKDSDDVWRLYAGYSFNRNFALELGYANLGKVSAQGTVGGTPLFFESKVTGFDLLLVGSVPLVGQLSAFGKLGAYRMRVKTEAVSGTDLAQPAETNSGLTYGLGLGYQLGIVGVRLEWQRYDNVGGASTGEDTVDVFGVGALVRF